MLVTEHLSCGHSKSIGTIARSERTGKKPTLRTYEMICYYFTALADEEELDRHIARLGEIDVPTLVIRGRYDMSTDAISATLVDGIRGAREVVLENSSHTPVLEETDEYLDAISKFMRAAETR